MKVPEFVLRSRDDPEVSKVVVSWIRAHQAMRYQAAEIGLTRWSGEMGPMPLERANLACDVLAYMANHTVEGEARNGESFTWRVVHTIGDAEARLHWTVEVVW